MRGGRLVTLIETNEVPMSVIIDTEMDWMHMPTYIQVSS